MNDSSGQHIVEFIPPATGEVGFRVERVSPDLQQLFPEAKYSLVFGNGSLGSSKPRLCDAKYRAELNSCITPTSLPLKTVWKDHRAVYFLQHRNTEDGSCYEAKEVVMHPTLWPSIKSNPLLAFKLHALNMSNATASIKEEDLTCTTENLVVIV